MIFSKFWAAIRAQLNKVANLFWEADPVAQMRYEYDKSVEELKEGRLGLEQYRGLVEKLTRQVQENEKQISKIGSQIKAYLRAGDRETASKFALQLQQAKTQLAENQAQKELHETSYQNNLEKIKHANKKLAEVRDKIQRYDAELKMSEAEAEIAKLSESFDVNVSTDFGQLEDVIQRKIDTNRGRARVAADLSREGIAEIEAERRMESVLAEDALKDFEVSMGLVSPETVPVAETGKALGPATTPPDTEPELPAISKKLTETAE
jgi:phage shock protein A